MTEVHPDPELILRAPRSRVRIGVGAAVVLVLVGLAVAVLVTALGSHGSAVAVSPGPAASGTSSSAASSPGVGASTTDLYVHVTGSVLRPGLFVLATGDRALDAIAAAGGFAPEADQAAVNLARPLVDGEQLVVPVIGVASGAAAGGAAGGAASGSVAGGLVNLNTADEAALDTLPGVGPATAKSILDWRKENGKFSTVEDLLSVTGIGEKTFDALKDLVKV